MGIDEFDDEPMGFEEESEEEWTPMPEPGEPGPYGLPPAKERLAGFWDGQRRGRALLLNAARSSLAKFHISVEDDGTVSKVEGIPTFDLLPVRDPDNPLNDQDYTEGWENGLASIETSLLESLRLNLVPLGIFLAGDGTAVTLREASLRVTGAAPSVAPLSAPSQPITDEALHRFLDGAPPPVAAQPATPAHALPPGVSKPSTPMTPESLMRLPNPNRRAVLAGVVSALVSGSVSWVAAQKLHPPSAGAGPDRAQVPTYVPPTVWDMLSKGVRQQFLDLDFVVWQMEQAGNGSTIASLIDGLMLQGPTFDPVKDLVAGYIRDTGRSAYLFALVNNGVVVSNSVPRIRRVVVTTAEYILGTQGGHAVGTNVANRLRQAQLQETDPSVLAILNRVIPKLDAAGL